MTGTDETYCFYCQHEFDTPTRLKVHVIRRHAGTYRAMAFEDTETE